MKLQLKIINEQPLLRICAFKRRSHVDINYDPNEFDLFDLNGHRLFEGVTHKGFWRLKIKTSQAPQYRYYLVLKESEKKKHLEPFQSEYNAQELRTSIKEVGGEIFLEERLISSNEKYFLLGGPFTSEQEAKAHTQEYGQLFGCRIYRELIKEGDGTIEIYDDQYENFTEVERGVELIPKDLSSYFQIKHFPIHFSQNNRATHEDLNYQGILKISIDEENSLTGINEIPVEDYLRGVLFSEIGQKAHLEFAKSMAIVARSYVFARMGQKHSNEGFDFCSDSHCLRYYGKKFDNPLIDKALEETRGLILKHGLKVCNAYFSYSCGGHTENTFGVWLYEDAEYMQGKFDGPEQDDPKLDLTNEEDVRRWILDRPNVYCRLDKTFLENNPELSANSFRWEEFYTRNELEEIIRKKTGKEIGVLYEIIPVKRGVSGRIKELQILGSLQNITISGETNIRSTLSERMLNSSCFIVQPDMDDEGVPINFLFIGAGMGHGVGLCKVGASRLASDGKTHQEIIHHYFNQCQTQRIY